MIINNAEIFCSKKNAKAKYLLVAGGREPDDSWLMAAAKGRTVVCADRGITYCQKAGVQPDYLLGDGDSAGGSWHWAKEKGAGIHKYPSDKDETDLQLALAYILKEDKTAGIVITGVWGGRFDHNYNNVYSALAAAERTAGPVVLSDEKETMAILPGPDELSIKFASEPEAISVLPLSESITVSIEGTKWEIKEKIVKKTNIYTISNRLKQESSLLKISLLEGQAGVYFLMKT